MEHAPPPFFKRGPTPLIRLLILALLSCMLLGTDAHFRYLGAVRQAFGALVYPVQRLAAAPASLLERIAGFFMSQAQLKAENARLAARNLDAAGLTIQHEALFAENTRLRKLLEARARLPGNAVMAEILYSARDPFVAKVVIDKGQSQDVKPGLAVVDDAGVVGQVTRVYPWVSEITLITDKDQAVPVQDLRSGFRGIVFGNGESGTLDLRFTPVSADIQNGDVLVTSGIDGTYPPGLPVAVISNIERNAALPFAKITCTPVAGVNRHGNVLVLLALPSLPDNPTAQEPPPKRKKARRGGSS